MAENLGMLAATTLQNYRDTMVDNIFKDNVLLNHLREKGGVEYEDGGRQIVVPLMTGTNSTVMPFSGAQTLDVTPQTGIDAATFDWKMYNVSVVITKEEELKNKGKSAVIKLLKAKVMQAENSLMERLNNDLFNGAASDSQEITGLQTLVDATGTYGNIDSSSNAYWASYEENTATALTLAHIRTGVNTVNKGAGGGKCSIIVTTQTLHEKVESLYAANLQMNPVVAGGEVKRLGDAGFSAINFRNIPLVWDEQCPSGELYFLNNKNLKLTIHQDANFKVIEKADPANQHVSVSHIMFMGNTTSDRRASLGKLTAKTA